MISEDLGYQKSRKVNRILALVISGIYVMVVLPLIGIFISLFLDSLFRFPKIFLFPMNIIISIIFLIIGVIFGIWSNFEIYRTGKGSPVPLKGTHTTELVFKGPYKYSRNPMVFGYILLWLGLGFLFNSIFLILGFTLIISLLLIILVKFWEEKNMTNRFGKSYLEYKSRVSFLIPLPQKKSNQETIKNE